MSTSSLIKMRVTLKFYWFHNRYVSFELDYLLKENLTIMKFLMFFKNLSIHVYLIFYSKYFLSTYIFETLKTSRHPYFISCLDNVIGIWLHVTTSLSVQPQCLPISTVLRFNFTQIWIHLFSANKIKIECQFFQRKKILVK